MRPPATWNTNQPRTHATNRTMAENRNNDVNLYGHLPLRLLDLATPPSLPAAVQISLVDLGPLAGDGAPRYASGPGSGDHAACPQSRDALGRQS
jgi:hypothetical protein